MARLLKGPDGKPMTDAEIKHALRVYATNKYGGENKYDFMAMGDTIAQVESGNNPFAKQKGGGPGRGKYQYEPPSAESASNRLRDIADIVGYTNPSWNTVENTKDLSKLTSDQQDIMFLADKLASGNVDLGSLASGETSGKDFWLDSHWSGKDVDRPTRGAHWDAIVADMKRKQEKLERNSRHVEEYNYGGKIKLKKYANGGSVGDPPMESKGWWDTLTDYYKGMKHVASYNPAINSLLNQADPISKLSTSLAALGVPGNLVAEAVEGIGGKGDGEFNITDAIPGMKGDFSFTNINDTPTKTVSGVTGVEGIPGFALDVATDPSSYVGVGIAKNLLKKGLPKVVKAINKPVNEGLLNITKGVAAKNTIVKKAGGHTTGNRYYDFLESRHPEALKQIESGKLSIDDVVSDKNILNDYVNRLETSYRGVAAEGLDDATKFLSKHNPDMHHSRQQLGSGIYSSLTSEGALPYALENAVSEKITPYLGRLRTPLPDWSENPRKLFKILKDRNLKGEYLDDPYGKYRGMKGFDAKKINQDPIYDAKYLGHRVHRPGVDPMLDDLVDLSKTKEWEKFKNLKRPSEDVIDNSYETYLDKRRDIIRSLDSKLKDLNILRPSLKKGGKIRLLKK